MPRASQQPNESTGHYHTLNSNQHAFHSSLLRDRRRQRDGLMCKNCNKNAIANQGHIPWKCKGLPSSRELQPASPEIMQGTLIWILRKSYKSNHCLCGKSSCGQRAIHKSFETCLQDNPGSGAASSIFPFNLFHKTITSINFHQLIFDLSPASLYLSLHLPLWQVGGGKCCSKSSTPFGFGVPLQILYTLVDEWKTPKEERPESLLRQMMPPKIVWAQTIAKAMMCNIGIGSMLEETNSEYGWRPQSITISGNGLSP